MRWWVGQKETGELDSMMINEYPITERANGMCHSNKCILQRCMYSTKTNESGVEQGTPVCATRSAPSIPYSAICKCLVTPPVFSDCRPQTGPRLFCHSGFMD